CRLLLLLIVLGSAPVACAEGHGLSRLLDLIELVDWPEDGLLRPFSREELDGQAVVEQSGNSHFEVVKGSEPVFADGEENMNVEVLLEHQAGEFRRKRQVAPFFGM